MWILIDDIRNGYGCEVIARTAEAAVEMLKAIKFEAAIFDHDLGEQLSGYDVMRQALDLDVLPRKIQLVTNNPVGRDNMIALLLNCGYTLGDDRVTYCKR